MTTLRLADLDWTPDILGPDFQAAYLPLGEDPDGEGDVRATLVRHLPTGFSPEDLAQRPAVVWIHGMTDYFFQSHVAQRLHQEGFAMYALDLRKCGRSWLPGQHWHYSTDFEHYDAELTLAFHLLTEVHPSAVPLAHSTGGLIVPLWLSRLGRHSVADAELARRIPAVVLNSPWLDMQYPAPLVAMVRVLCATVGRWRPLTVIPGADLDTYGRSVHQDYEGQWDFDLRLKPLGGCEKQFGWLRAVLVAQRSLHRGLHLDVPVLTLCSAHSNPSAKPGSPETQRMDTVLDTEQIRRWAPTLSNSATVRSISGALHDVYLSSPAPREEAFSTTVDYLSRLVPSS